MNGNERFEKTPDKRKPVEGFNKDGEIILSEEERFELQDIIDQVAPDRRVNR